MANIARWDPFEDSPFDIFPALFGRQPTLRTADARMRMDVVETDADYRVSIDLPGIDKDSIQVSVDDGKSEARHVDGVLYLTLPKAAGSMKRLTVH
jgi:HSP20 family molecular chaperone IbpA